MSSSTAPCRYAVALPDVDFVAENTDGPILRNFIHPQVGEVPQSDSAYLSPFITIFLTCVTNLGANRRLGLSWARCCGPCNPFVTTLERLNVALLYTSASIVPISSPLS